MYLPKAHFLYIDSDAFIGFEGDIWFWTQNIFILCRMEFEVLRDGICYNIHVAAGAPEEA